MKQLEEIEEDAELSKEYGVNHRSILLELKYFNMCTGELLPDVMHDLLEGVLQYEIKLLLVHSINNRFFTLDFLNSRIESLELCYGSESDRQAPIDGRILNSDSHLLKQKVICMHMTLLYSFQNISIF